MLWVTALLSCSCSISLVLSFGIEHLGKTCVLWKLQKFKGMVEMLPKDFLEFVQPSGFVVMEPDPELW